MSGPLGTAASASEYPESSEHEVLRLAVLLSPAVRCRVVLYLFVAVPSFESRYVIPQGPLPWSCATTSLSFV